MKTVINDLSAKIDYIEQDNTIEIPWIPLLIKKM